MFFRFFINLRFARIAGAWLRKSVMGNGKGECLVSERWFDSTQSHKGSQ